MTRLATDAEIADLREGLEGVTPGPWQWVYDEDPMMQCWRLAPGIMLVDGTDCTPGGDKIDRANAAHLIRCSPDFIAALLARLDARESALREAREIVKPFAERCAEIDDVANVRRFAGGGTTLVSLSALRDARAWLAKQEPGEGEEPGQKPGQQSRTKSTPCG